MLLLGLIAIFQTIFIPGFLLINLLKIRTGSSIEKWLYIFSFSLFFNYVLVTILTLFSVYYYWTMWCIIVLEFIILLLFFRVEIFRIFTGFNFSAFYVKYIELLKSNSSVTRIIVILSSLIVLFYTAVFFANIGTIFYFIDTVNNYEWNSWAIDFANNILPKYSSHFPQLLPANWSISYVLIGKTDVHFFPKAIMPLFFIGNLLIFIDLAFSRKNYVFLIGLIIYGIFGPIVYSLVFIVDGNADLPVSFFAFLTFYSFLKITQDNFELRYYLITFLFASMTAAAKLAGFYTFTVTSVVLGILLFLNRNNVKRKNFIYILLFMVIISCFSLFWYFKAPEEMVTGLHQPQYLLHTDYLSIGVNALKMMYNLFGPPVFAFFIITIAASFFDKKNRFITLIMVTIPTIIWMFKHSVDFRNLSFVVPYLSACSAVGLSVITRYISKEYDYTLKTVINSEKIQNLSNKETKILLLTSFISGVLLLVFLSDKFYLFLLNSYDFIYKYYFQRQRIEHFIEYGFLLHVDFYQRVLVSLSTLFIILPALLLTRLRTVIILTLFTIGSVCLNFTLLNKKNILQHQEIAFNKVDARNYYNWLKMYISSNQLHNEVNTNFKAILTDKISRDIKFKYFGNISEKSLLVRKKKFQVFLKQDTLDSKTLEFINDKIEQNEYQLVFNDNYYIFFVINPS